MPISEHDQMLEVGSVSQAKTDPVVDFSVTNVKLD